MKENIQPLIQHTPADSGNVSVPAGTPAGTYTITVEQSVTDPNLSIAPSSGSIVAASGTLGADKFLEGTSELGIVFLLFMVGLEIDLKKAGYGLVAFIRLSAAPELATQLRWNSSI